jgi:DegV family protein with EDD domain
MRTIALVTDSTAYLRDEDRDRYEITVVPLQVLMNGESFREGVDLTHREFYERMRNEKTLPTTSQPSPGAFAEVFERLLQTHDEVLCLTLSDGLSGTFASANQGAQMVATERVCVVDSRIASYGIAGPLLDAAWLHREQGATREQILAHWGTALATMKSRFLLSSLEALHRGGRIGGASAVFGALLQIKPILTVRDGKIDLYEKVRTHRKGLERILEEFKADAAQGVPLQLGVVHANRPEDALSMAEQLRSEVENASIEVAELGPVIGAHVGEGLLALVYYERTVNRPCE